MLDTYVALLETWQRRTNLVAPATLPDVWHRHVGDSLQFHALASDATRWVDLGSGGGFPGIVTAILCAQRGRGRVDLVESVGKKAAFLAAVVGELRLPAAVHATRIERCEALLAQADAVGARALAPLDALLGMVAGRIPQQARCFFAKGRNHGEEIVDAERRWRFTMTAHASRTENGAAILEIGGIERRVSET